MKHYISGYILFIISIYATQVSVYIKDGFNAFSASNSDMIIIKAALADNHAKNHKCKSSSPPLLLFLLFFNTIALGLTPSYSLYKTLNNSDILTFMAIYPDYSLALLFKQNYSLAYLYPYGWEKGENQDFFRF